MRIKVDEIKKEEVAELLNKWKPQFGNLDDMRIVELARELALKNTAIRTNELLDRLLALLKK